MPVHDGIKSRLRIAQGFGMAVDVKLVCLDGIKHQLCDLGRTHFATAHRLVAHGLANQLALRGLGSGQTVRSVALALVDASWHKVRAKHTGTHLLAHQHQVLVEGLGQRDHCVLGDVVNAHVGWSEQASHAGRVDNVALIMWVIVSRL